MEFQCAWASVKPKSELNTQKWGPPKRLPLGPKSESLGAPIEWVKTKPPDIGYGI